jgi:hypothetical protein
MTCPELHPLPHNASFSRSSDYATFSRPGTTAAQTVRTIRDLEQNKRRIAKQLSEAKELEKKPAMQGIFSQVET